MLSHDAGVIVNVAAPQSHKRGGPGASIHYAAAKGAVVTMTMGVARVYSRRKAFARCLSLQAQSIRRSRPAAGTSEEFVEKARADVRQWAGLAARMKFGEMVLFMCSDALRLHDGGYGLHQRRGRLALSAKPPHTRCRLIRLC